MSTWSFDIVICQGRLSSLMRDQRLETDTSKTTQNSRQAFTEELFLTY